MTAPATNMFDYAAIQQQAVVLLNEERFREAETLLRQVLASGSGPIPLWWQLVFALRPQGKVEESRQILEMIVRTIPGDMGARFD